MPEYIGHYRLERPLGRGGMGEVFLAWDERLERRVAVKRIRPDLFAQESHRERFRREARMAARLSHPAIVQVYDLVTDDAGDALVMEYVEGLTLADRIRGRPMDTLEAVRLARQIAEGLAAAHQEGLIHRDLKAENVVVTPSGHAKILDFGLARPVSGDEKPLTQHGTVIGTSHAMSPEQASGEDLDARTDLFSLGVLLYEMLTGCSPFRAKNAAAALKKLLTEDPPSLAVVRPHLPSDLALLGDQLLAKDRRRRPRTAEQVVQRLERIERWLLPKGQVPELTDSQVDLPTDAFPVVPSPPGSTPALLTSAVGVLRRFRAPRRLMAAAVVLAMVVGGTSYLVVHRAGPPLRVLVMVVEPESSDDERLGLATSGARFAAMHALRELRGIVSFDSTAVADTWDFKDAALLSGADEVLKIEVRAERERIRVELKRLHPDEELIFAADDSVPPDELLALADLVGRKIESLYSEYPARPDATLVPEARSEDFRAFLQVRQRLAAAEDQDTEAELAELEKILRSSPNFVDAYVEAAKISLSLYRSYRRIGDLKDARQLVQKAASLDRGSPLVLREQFNIALLDGHLKTAEDVLGSFQELRPGHPDILFLRSRLFESQERWTEAEEALREAVARDPSWWKTYWLADLLIRRRQVDEARRLLQDVLTRMPQNSWAGERLAHLELVYGNLDEAEPIYRELADRNPQRSYFTNLGQIEWLRGRYAEARDCYFQATNLEPGAPAPTLNLAEAEWQLGNEESARPLFGAVLRAFEEREQSMSLEPRELMMKAKCLARLDRAAEARGVVQLALRLRPNDPEILYDAALVHNMLGSVEAAAELAGKARDLGLSEHWLKAPGLETLRQEPDRKDRLAVE